MRLRRGLGSQPVHEGGSVKDRSEVGRTRFDGGNDAAGLAIIRFLILCGPGRRPCFLAWVRWFRSSDGLNLTTTQAMKKRAVFHRRPHAEREDGASRGA